MNTDEPQPEPLPSTEDLIKHLYGNGKPLLFVLVATQIAASVDALTALMKELIGKKRSPKHVPPVPPITEWLRMYRRHNQMWNKVDLLQVLDDESEFTGQEGARGFRALVAMPSDERNEVIRENFSDDELRELLSLLAGIEFPPRQEVVTALVKHFEEEADSDADQLDDFMGDVEVQFFFRVWVPCWIIYQEYPSNLMRRARQGDLDAMDNLLRLDKSVIHDPQWRNIGINTCMATSEGHATVCSPP